MKILIVILLASVPQSGIYSQVVQKCDCGALIDVKYKGQIIVFNKPNGKQIKSLQQNFKAENYLVLNIDKDSVNFFHVDISYALPDSKNIIGWIKKTAAIGIYTRNYSPRTPLYLYTKPNLKSEVMLKIDDWTNQFYTIKQCDNKWVYVRINYKGQIKEGWLQPDQQCDNPYSTCN